MGRVLSAARVPTAEKENWHSMISAHLSCGSVGLSRVLSRVVLAAVVAAAPARQIRGDSPALQLRLPRLDSPRVETYPVPALPDEPVKRVVFERINRDLKRARKAAGLDFDENPEQVKFILEEARILAMLEIADALREAQADTEA